MSVAFTSFPGLPTSVAAARRFVAGAIRLYPHSAAPGEVVDRAELITSELCTNALRHTRSGEPGQSFTVWIRVDEHGVRGEVHTPPARLPHLIPQVVEAHPWCESGRGLFLVDQLATKWGTLTPWQNGVFFLLTWPQPR